MKTAIAVALLCLMFSGCYTTTGVVTYDEPIRIHYPHYYWIWGYHPYHYEYYYHTPPTWIVAPYKPLPPPRSDFVRQPEHKTRTTGNTRGQRH